MKIKTCMSILTLCVGTFWLTACGKGTGPYIAPPKPAEVHTVDVEIREFGGRPDAYALVEGNLSNGNAQLVDAQQRREGYRLFIEVREQTPRGAGVSAETLKPFKQKIPIETIGLTPGVYILNVNGVEKRLDLPSAASLNTNRGEML
ncbi:hypothetical protein OAE61_02850 [Verrucomicrobiales bacterium]|nr:hypothetical protein [Verrucomicrobiales bacterium]